MIRAAAIAASVCLLLVALPSEQRRPYRTSEFPVLSPYRHDPRERLEYDRIARVGTQWYGYFGRDSIALFTLR